MKNNKFTQKEKREAIETMKTNWVITDREYNRLIKFN